MTVLGVAVLDRVPLGGGAARVGLADGRTVVVKDGDPAAVAAEAAGLRWLCGADAARVPAVLDVDGGRLVTELVAGAAPSARAADELGRALARTHAAGAPAFGAAPPGGPADARIGAAPMRNAPAPSWAEWYAADRVLPYLRTARDAGTLTADATGQIEAATNRLTELSGPAEPPARLHGDLWSGNVLWSPAGAVLIDPAAHGGHRETDLAMLALFGCPHLHTVIAAYDQAAPLAAGWRERVPLHQLFPLLVHVVLFGGGYAAQAVSAARAALRAG
ncbi:fructosamine kinase family protein [Pseudonocardia sp. DLS-67]